MTFFQLQYTSCRDGLSGYSGFQFCAATPGVPREIMREVERRTIYELPSAVRETEDKSGEKFPVNLLFTKGEDSDIAILARVQFTGLDFSNRSGNYFAHSLITTSSGDLRSLLPIELWDSPFWQSQQGTSTELPPLTGPPEAGPITRGMIADFLASQVRSGELTTTLLTAVDQAISAGRQLLLIGPDTDSVCRWIAAVSYLLEPGLARQMTFSTYSYDPRRCRTHVVGTIPAARPLRANIASSFHVFDLDQGIIPDLSPSPSAQILARLGVDVAPELWRLAGPLGAPQGMPLNDTFPILASAALISGHRLTADEFGAAIEWLGTVDSAVSSDQVRAAAANALVQPLDEISADRQERLIELTARADDWRMDDGSLTSRIESAIVEGSLRRIDRKQPLGAGVRLKTEAAKRAAADGCSQRLPKHGLATAIDLLAWASVVGVEPDNTAVRNLGRRLVSDGLLESQPSSQLVEVARRWRAVRTGVLEGLASLSISRQEVLVRGPAGQLFKLVDFQGHYALGVQWIIGMVRGRRVSRTTGLSQIIELRKLFIQGPLIDADLLETLWEGDQWTVSEATELLGSLLPDELAYDVVLSRLVTLLHDVPLREDPTKWIAFVAKLAELPTGILPSGEADLAAELSQLTALMDDIPRQASADEALEILVDRYDTVSPTSAVFLDRCLPSFLLLHSQLGVLLTRCPHILLDNFCDFAANAIANKQLRLEEIASVFVAMLVMRSTNSRYSDMLEKHVLLPTLSTWKADEINMLGIEADRIAVNSSTRLEFWYRRARRRRFRLRLPRFRL